MRDATRHIHDDLGETGHRGDGFVFGAILCAAVLVAVLALHGGPNLLGERFDPTVFTAER